MEALQTGTRWDALQRQKTLPLIKEFNQQLKVLGNQHHSYALTITPNHRCIKRWWRVDEEERFVESICGRLVHMLSSHAQKNYQRNAHLPKRMIVQAFIEHLPRKQSWALIDTVIDKETHKYLERTANRDTVHFHGLVGIHRDWLAAVLECFKWEQKICEDGEKTTRYTLKEESLKGKSGKQLWSEIYDVHLVPVFDDHGWMEYETKFLGIDRNESGAFTLGFDIKGDIKRCRQESTST